MSIMLQLSSTNYTADRLCVKMALSHLETLCKTHGGYALSEPDEMAGWTFFRLIIKPDLHEGIMKEFEDMLSKSRWSSPDVKFVSFMQEYFSARNCNVKVKIYA
ncbi:hypothetical protein CENSYa_1075 [Cenarchaeum symbiosum A]|uniref:Uncharacterized protein n=1 Tax=Cenarchaeum symbiosum (strain A) TaxID=414004 RepID=A0RWI8_CENSY|nr:hypothetical protein CENSYa_1075 [Cenarchaeum symbiosum A]